MTVRWRASALLDLANIVSYVQPANPIAAERIGAALRDAGESLKLFPYRGRAGRDRRTRELVTVWPYIIVYRVTPDDGVDILRIWHGAQDRR